MLVQKLLKKPARLLLITYVATSSFTMSVSSAAPRISVAPAHRQNSATSPRARARLDLLFQGVDRWGLNE